MDFFENLSGTLSDLGKNVAKETNKIVEVSKLKLSLGSKKTKVKSLYEEIGKKVFESSDEEIIEKLGIYTEISEISELNEIISETENEISEIKNQRKCPSCGASIGTNDPYCKICGNKIN